MANQQVNIQITVTGANPAAQQIAGVGNAAKKAHSSVFNLRNLLLGFTVKGLVVGLGQLSDAATRIDNRLNVLTGSQARSNELFNELLKVSQATRRPLEDTVDAYARIERSAYGLNLTTQQLIDLTKGINQSFQIFGNTSKEASAALVQFTQGLSVGVLRGDELRSVLEQAPRLAKAIADGLNEIPEGKDLAPTFGRLFKDFETGAISSELLAGSLRKLGAEGKLTSEIITQALLTQLPKLNEEFARTKPTIQDAFVVLKNSLIDVARSPVFQEISSQFGGMIIAVSDWVTANKEGIAKFFAVFGQIGVFLGKVLGAFGKFFGTVIDNFVQFVGNFSKGSKTIEDNGKAGAENFGNGFIKVIGHVYEAFKTLVEVFARGAAAIGGFMGSLARNIGNLFGKDPAIESLERLEVFLAESRARNIEITEDYTRRAYAAILKQVQAARQLTNPFEDAQREADKFGQIVAATFKPIDSLADDLGQAFVDFSVDTVDALNKVDAAAKDLGQSTLQTVAGGKQALPAETPLDANDQRRLDSFIQRMDELSEKTLKGKDALLELKRAEDQYQALLKDPEIAKRLKSQQDQFVQFAELKTFYTNKTVEELIAENKAEAEAAQASLDHYAARRLLNQALKNGNEITPEMVDQLAAVLKEEREIKQIQQEKESILSSLTRKSEQYAAVLSATNQLLAEGKISEAERNRRLEATEFGQADKEIDKFITDSSANPDDKLAGQLAALEAERDMRMGFLQDMYDAEFIMKDEFEQKMTALTDIYTKQRTQIEMEAQRLQYQNASSAFGEMAELSLGFVKESSGLYKALFFASKAFAIADGIVKLNQAIMNASVSLPFPANLAAMAQVGASGLALLTSIKSAVAPQLALKDGGWVTGPGGPRDDGVQVAASNGEYVVNAAAAARNSDLLEAINSGRFNAGQSGQGMTLNLTQNYNGQGLDRDGFRASGRQLAEDTARTVQRATARVI